VTQLLLYLPVIHAGYEQLLDRYPDAGVLILGRSFAADFPVLGKEIRALAPERAAAYVARPDVRVVETDQLPDAVTAETLVVPDEDVLHEIVLRWRLDEGRQIVWEPTFLRWDRPWSLAARPVDHDGEVAADPRARELAGLAALQAERSPDWWRQVGAVAVRDGAVVASARNAHHPTDYSPYVNGDPRNNFRRGVALEASTAIHAEARLVARAAATGLALAGCDLYVTTFPCPACARLVAEAGFRSCHFSAGYSVLDGADVLRSAGVRLVWVDPG
jgi:dCMP deaminase